MKNKIVVVRGGGDLATGTIHRLWSAKIPVIVLEAEKPAAIRRQVSVCEAVYDGETIVENMKAVCIDEKEKAWEWIEKGQVPVLVDPKGESLPYFQPQVLVDAILAKKNLGTTKDMAPLTIALGPGFCAGIDVDYVIETKRGHNLGRIIAEGEAVKNTGIPGNIGGYTKERVLHGIEGGIFHNINAIGEIVEKGSEIGWIETEDGRHIAVEASITGILRGLLRDGYWITKGFKIADIDPRKEELKNCFTISDKARCIAGSVLELVIAHFIGEDSFFEMDEKYKLM